MKFQLLTLMIIIRSSLTAQDTIKQNIPELWWNDSVEIINKRNVTLTHDDALTLIRNQPVSYTHLTLPTNREV